MIYLYLTFAWFTLSIVVNLVIYVLTPPSIRRFRLYEVIAVSLAIAFMLLTAHFVTSDKVKNHPLCIPISI